MAKGEKLVRDFIPDGPIIFNEYATFRKASQEEMPQLLSNKILEEATELTQAISDNDRPQIIEEIADIRQVAEAIAVHFHIPEAEINFRKSKKLKLKGGFSKRIVRRQR